MNWTRQSLNLQVILPDQKVKLAGGMMMIRFDLVVNCSHLERSNRR